MIFYGEIGAKRLWITALLIFLFCSIGLAEENKDIYLAGVEAAKSGDLDSAFIYFHSIVVDTYESRYKPDAIFATGEYYFDKGDYRDANEAFIRMVNDYPNSKANLFGLAYLLKISQIQGNADLENNLKNKIINFQQQIFLFKNSKKYKYKSPLCKKHKAVYYIDKIQFYLDGEIFEQISY